MTILKKLTGLTAIALSALAIFSAPADAALVVAQSPTGYFVPSDYLKYNSPYYRDYSGDWGWSYNPVSGSITSATLQISAFDVDYGTYSYMEHDLIYAYDAAASTWIYLGELIGSTDAWAFTTFTLGSDLFDDIATGLQVKIDIDSTSSGWLVTLAKASLGTEGDIDINPNPGEVPEPASMALLGMGMLGMGVLRNRRRHQSLA